MSVSFPNTFRETEGTGWRGPVLDPKVAEREASAAFATSVLDSGSEIPEGVIGPNGTAVARRFAVYRNNVIVGLVDALAATFPAVQRIVGERFFRAAARLHAIERPPTSPLMAEYGREFPSFLETFEPAQALPYLPDVARIERAWLDAYHAADAQPLEASALAAIPQHRLAGLRFAPHPATRIVRSRFAAVSATAANRTGEAVPQIDLTNAEDALIVRPGLEVALIGLPPGGASFLGALLDGRTLGDAAAIASAESDEFDLAANIGGALTTGAFSNILNDRPEQGERP